MVSVRRWHGDRSVLGLSRVVVGMHVGPLRRARPASGGRNPRVRRALADAAGPRWLALPTEIAPGEARLGWALRHSRYLVGLCPRDWGCSPPCRRDGETQIMAVEK